MVGRAGKYDFGFLNMQSKTTDDYLSENYGVFRFRRDIINENSYLGGMLTSIFNKDGSYNIAYGLDALINVAGDEYLNINVAQSYGETGGEYDPADSWNRSRMHLMLQRRKNVGFGYQLSFNHVGDSYNPELGFENRKNYWRLGDEIFYNFWMPEESKLQKIDVSLQSRAFISYETNELESSQISPEISIVGKNEFLLNTSFDMIFDHPRDTFDLSDDIFIVPDKYYNNTINLSYSSPRINLFVLTMNYSQGGYYGGEIQSPGIGFNYLPSKYLQLDFFYEYNNIKIPGFPMYESHLGRFILTSSLNVKWTLSAFLQYNSNQNLWILNSRLRYNPKDGVNLYIVYNENFNSDIYRESPALPKSDSHSFVIKYSHTFEF